MVSSHPLSSQQQVEWVVKLQPSTEEWQMDQGAKEIMGWIHCRLSFAILCSAILCIHQCLQLIRIRPYSYEFPTTNTDVRTQRS